jgi:hypothetical protein
VLRTPAACPLSCELAAEGRASTATIRARCDARIEEILDGISS